MRTSIHHFKRAMAVFTAIAAAMALPDLSQRTVAMARVPEYRSRGKGRGSVSRNWMRPYPHNEPHQGKQECARRRRQIAAGILNRENELVSA